MPFQHQLTVKKYVNQCDDLYSMFIPSSEVHCVNEAIKLTKATTINIPALGKWKSKYYSSIDGCHDVVVLAMHVDDGNSDMDHISIAINGA